MTDYSEQVKALKSLANGIWKDREYTWFCGEEKVFSDAAVAIEALQAQLPKHGEWIVTTETSDDGAVSQHINCSVCGFYWREPKHRKVFKRCPNCGAKMEAQE